MGIFDSITGGIFGGPEAARDASAGQIESQQQAIQALQQQFGQTQQNLAPFLQAGQGAAPGVAQAADIGGFGERLQQLLSGGSLDPLIEERGRAVQGQLSAGGLTRSGTALQEAARVPTDLLFQIENMLSGRGQQLFGQGIQTGLGQGQLGAQAAGGQANLLSGIGQTRASGILGEQQAQAGLAENLIGGAGALASRFGEGGKGLEGAGTIASLFFSDPSLKENVEQIGEAYGLKIYQWDWIERAKDTMIGKCGTMGFMSDQVRDKFPEFVHKFAGYDIVDYPGLLNKLEAA